jgi:hypothetical protein
MTSRCLRPERFATLLVATLLTLAPAGRLEAQAGAATDIVRGRITTTGGEAVVGAHVTVTSLETGVSRTAISDARGRYTVVFVDGGGRYRVSARAIGYTPVQTVVARVADEDVLVADLRMGGLPVQVSEIRVEATRAPPLNADPGAELTALPGPLMERLPLEGRDPTDLVALTPNAVTGLGGSSDSAEAEQTFSLGGGRTALNRITLDGLSLGSALSGGRAGGAAPWSVPPEAVRGTQVVVSSYDVSRGQFAGGQVASQSSRGTNVPFGQLSYRTISPSFQSGFGALGGPTPYSLHELSGGLGGPLRRDRAHYFVSLAARRRTDHPFALTAARADMNGRVIGVSADSLARFMAIADTVHGISTLSDTGAYERPGDALSGLVRLDYNLGRRHHVILRGHYTWYRLENTRIGPFDLTQNGGDAGSRSRGLFLGVTTQLGAGGGALNELRVEYLFEGRPTLRTADLPQGSVRVISEFPDGARGITTLAFGGERSLPTTLAERRFEATDEVSLIWAETHRLKLGAYAHLASFTQSGAGNRLGTFTFNSLAAFENRQPASFTRTLDARPTEGAGYSLALYLGDAWRASGALQLVYGIRWEADGYLDRPGYNSSVDSSFALRTDRIGAGSSLSPRAGFTLRLSRPREVTMEELIQQFAPRTGRGAGRQADSLRAVVERMDPATQGRIRQMARAFAEQQSARILRGGIGVFRGPPPLGLYASSLNNDGLAGSEGLLVCTGPSVPTPDYPSYAQDPSAIPDACDGPPSAGARRAPLVAVFDPSFEAPASLRATLGFQTPLWRSWQLAVDLLGSWGRRLYLAQDVNLDSVPEFVLGDEGDRPVYAPVSEIAPLSGEVPLTASRRDTAFGHVLVLRSTGRSWTRSIALRLTGRVRRTLLTASYTYGRTQDENSFSCCSALQGFAAPTTAGNPNVLERTAASFDRRHSFTLMAGLQLPLGLQLTAIGRVGSGTPYTPVVSGDVNGDGVRNDRAFVFGATAADTAVASAMARLLATAPEGARACLERQVGTVAQRNSCRSPWFQTLDLRLTGRLPVGGAVERRVEISVDFFNVLAGLDELLHSDDLKGWGATNQIPGNEPLLFVRGFDPQAGRFRYEVNEQFGRPRWAQFGVGNPFQMQLSVRWLIGGRPGAILGGVGGPGGGPRR